MKSKEFKLCRVQGTGAQLMVAMGSVALGALALGAQAQTYQSAWSSASVNEIYTERTDNLYGNGLMLSATHYFAPVKWTTANLLMSSLGYKKSTKSMPATRLTTSIKETW
jgi:hypothetical protein